MSDINWNRMSEIAADDFCEEHDSKSICAACFAIEGCGLSLQTRDQIATLTRERDEARESAGIRSRVYADIAEKETERAITAQRVHDQRLEIVRLEAERDEARQQLADKDREIERLRRLTTVDSPIFMDDSEHKWITVHNAANADRAEQAKRESKECGDGC